ncbi:hypothetical protein JAAARDRAFT_200064 [Jaapia argillacea MUCL 33604]|uniref:Uncharacterized protein n=1 Tax=Jaapia argillacea MUCL 33604 TaxID=933084 RepID=A0A067P995_9AGAM|nr:hypothetical protein JAAARDRAFT_200064 [Jaapia argillacea MUCL 33604]
MEVDNSGGSKADINPPPCTLLHHSAPSPSSGTEYYDAGAEGDDDKPATRGCPITSNFHPVASGSSTQRCLTPASTTKDDLRDLTKTLQIGFNSLFEANKAMGENFAQLVNKMEQLKLSDSGGPSAHQRPK